MFAQERLGIPNGTIRATVLIETLPAAFEMEEILYELRDHVAGLNAGRWDYIFSFIKKLAKHKDYILPDRSQVVMGEAFLGAYAALLVKTCHSRGAFAMGGMAAQIPVKNDPAANDAAFAKVRADKEREVRDGYDGTWVAHPDLVPVAREVFDRMMPEKNQITRVRQHVRVLREDLLKIHAGTKTEDGFRLNIRVGVQYIEAWLRGRGAVPIYNLMEDAATAEISRAQIWQWIRYEAELDGGIVVTPKYFERALDEEMERVKDEIGADSLCQGPLSRRRSRCSATFRSRRVRGFSDHPGLPLDRIVAPTQLHAAGRRNSIAHLGRDGCAGPQHLAKPNGACHGVQHPHSGRGLWLAARLQDAVRRALREPCLPSGRGRPDQFRRVPRAVAGEGPQGPGDPRHAQSARQGLGRGPEGGQPEGLRPDRPGDAGAAIPLARRARTARRGREVGRADHVDHEHAAAAVCEAHPGPRLRGAQARLHRCVRVGQFRSGLADAVQPRPAGDPSAGREGQRADGHACRPTSRSRSSTTRRAT